MHNLWRQIGSPKTGVINNARLKSKLEYKLAIKQAASNSNRKQGRELGEHLLHKDSTISGNVGTVALKSCPIITLLLSTPPRPANARRVLPPLSRGTQPDLPSVQQRRCSHRVCPQVHVCKIGVYAGACEEMVCCVRLSMTEWAER